MRRLVHTNGGRCRHHPPSEERSHWDSYVAAARPMQWYSNPRFFMSAGS